MVRSPQANVVSYRVGVLLDGTGARTLATFTGAADWC